MKYLTKTGLLAAAGLILILPIVAASRLVSASGTDTLSLSPASNTYAQGDRLDLDIHEDSGSDTVNAAHVVLTYSSSLTFAGADNSNDFSVAAQTTGSGGTATIDRGTCGGCAAVSGDKIVATVHFTANRAGTASVNFDSSSIVVRSTNNQAEAMAYNGGSYTITSPASMTLSPASKTVNQGDTLDVQVYADSATDPINAVQVNLTYPNSLLNFVSITNNATDWPVVSDNSGSSGLVKIGRGIQPGGTPLTGRHLVSTVRFTAVAAGNAQVAISTGSGMVRAADNTAEPSNNTGGSYTINAVASTPPPASGGSSTPPTTNKKSSSPAPAPPKSVTSSPGPQGSPVTVPLDTAAPAISDIKAVNLTANSATITWQTSEPATSEVDYGLNTKFILSKIDLTLTTSHSLALDSKELAAHKTFHFVVKSADAAGNVSASEDMTFSTGSALSVPKVAAISAGVVVVGATIWAVASGLGGAGGGLGGAASGAAAGGIYVEPKPLIVGGGAPPPPPPNPVVQPQTQAAQKPSSITKTEEPQTPGKVITPKSPPK